MRTSNKILLGAFLLFIFTITAVQLALYAKYSRGDVVEYSISRKENFENHLFTKLPSCIYIRNITSVSLVKSDSTHLYYEKDTYKDVRYTMNGDTLFIEEQHLDNNSPTYYYNDDMHYMKIQVNGKVPVIVEKSSLFAYGNMDSVNAPSFDITIKGGQVTFMADQQMTNKNSYFDSLDLSADMTSQIVFKTYGEVRNSNGAIYNYYPITVRQMMLDLKGSKFDDGNSRLLSLHVNADQQARLTLSNGNWNRLKMISHE